ncbi:MAG: hypothetical protein WCA12_05090, partial [Burkholderiales bacterium]
DASLREHEGDWTVEGDPMEGALLAFAGKTGVDWRDERSTWTRTDAIPFDAKHRFMATLNHDHEEHAFVFVKGAPERIVSMCKEQRSASGGVQPLEQGFWHESADRIASQGQRVLALASRPVLPEHTVLEHAEVEGSLTLLGLVGLIDPPRSEAIAAVGECHLQLLADTEAYHTLEDNLKRMGFERAENEQGVKLSWRWQTRTEHGALMVLELLADAPQMAGGRVKAVSQ